MFHFSLDFSIGFDTFDARKSFEMAANKFAENEKAKRVTQELQLRRDKAADELFARLYPAIERLARSQVEGYAYDARVGNILSVTTEQTEIKVSRKEQVEALLFWFDSFTKELQITFEGGVQYHRILRVEPASGDGTKPILHDRKHPSEPFVPISWNDLPRIVAESVRAVLGVL